MGKYADMLLSEPAPKKAPAKKPEKRSYSEMLLEPQTPKAPPADDRSFGERAVDWAKQTWTGEGQADDLPEITEAKIGFVESIIPNAKLGLTTDPAQKAKIIANHFADDARFGGVDVDSKGNPVVVWEGKPYLVNKPGASIQDATDIIANFVQYLPAAMVGGAAKNLLARMGLTGFATGGTSVAQDVTANESGAEISGEDIATKAAVTGATGGAFEALGPFAAKLWRAMPWRRGLIDKTGRLTAKGRKFAQAAGVDPDDITPDVARQMDDIARRYSPGEVEGMIRRSSRAFAKDADAATDARAVTGTAESRALEIPMTAGQASGNIRQQAREQAMINAARGDAAADTMDSFMQRQRGRVASAADDIQGKLSGGTRQTDDAVDAAGQVAEGVQETAQAANRRVDDAYAAVREASDASTRLNVGTLKGFAQNTRQALQERGAVLDPELTPFTVRAMQQMGKLSRAAKGGRVTKLTLRELEKYRRKLNAWAKEAKPQDAAHVRTIKREFDRFLDDAFDNQLFEGNPETLKLLKDARKQRAQFGSLFEARGVKDDAGKIIEKIRDGDRTNVEVANWLYGASKVGQKGSSARLVDRLKEILPEQQLDSLREGVWHRLVYGNSQKRAESLSYDRIYNDLTEALQGQGREYMERLYSKSELAAMETFRRALSRLRYDPRAKNPSKSGYEFARAAQDMISKLPFLMGAMTGNPVAGAAAGTGGQVVRGISQRAAARNAANPSLALPRPRITPLFPAAGAAAVNQDRDEPLRITIP